MSNPLEHKYTVPQLLLFADIQKDILGTKLHPALNALSEELFNIVEDHQSRRNEVGQPVYRKVKGTMVRESIEAVNELLVQDLAASKPNTEQLQRLKDNLLRLNRDTSIMATLGQEAYLESVNNGMRNSGTTVAKPHSALLYTTQQNGRVNLLVVDEHDIKKVISRLEEVNQHKLYDTVIGRLNDLVEKGSPIPRADYSRALRQIDVDLTKTIGKPSDHVRKLGDAKSSLGELARRDRIDLFEKPAGRSPADE